MTEKLYNATKAEEDASGLHHLMVVINNRLGSMVNPEVPRLASTDAELWETLCDQLKQASYLAYKVRRNCLNLQP